MACHACGQENPAGARFCNSCGAALAGACPACGHANPPGASFCNACGSALAAQPEAAKAADAAKAAEPPRAEASDRSPRSYTPRHLAERILESRSALEGERRHVTVLFCDLADSTPIAERLGPEAMHAVMDRCFAILLDEVHRYEGTVNQFLGDGVMALFGAPLALEDAPRRAVSAGLAIQQAIAPLAAEVEAEHGVPLRLRIGIHSGPVVVGSIGDDLRMDYTAVGDTTNLAARLEGLAPPGGVLISDAVRSLVEGWFELEDRGELHAKGKAEPVRAYAVQAERAVMGRVEARAEAGLTPLIGRDRELESLQLAYESAAAGQGQVVFLVGEAGLGKSRLRFELQRQIGGSAEHWLEGRCMTYARDFPLHPLVDALRRAFEIDPADDDATVLRKIDEREAELGGALAWTLPYVRRLLSLPSGDPAVDALDAASLRSETFRALRARIQRAAQEHPFVLVIEDIHWIDPASEEFLAYLIDGLPTSRILLILTHRPGYGHPFGDRSYHVRLVLRPLSPDEMGEMAGAVLDVPSLPGRLRQVIAARAEGNPFFVEEVVQSLLEEGRIRKRGAGVEVVGTLEGRTVPDSIQDVLMARLDRLPDEPRRALQIGAVIGREFALRLLERIAEAGDRLGPAIDELRALELIYEKSEHPELAFMFKHALTRDVAYDSVLETRRRALHGVVASAIEELYRDRLGEQVEHLAHHFRAAEQWEKAFEYAALAAHKSAAVFANRSAVEHARHALEIAERLGDAIAPAERRQLEELCGAASFAMSEFRASASAFRRAAALADTAEDVALNQGRAAHSCFWGHDYAALDAAVAACEEASRENGFVDGLAFGRVMTAFRMAIEGDLGPHAELLEQVEKLAPEAPEVVILLRYVQGEYAEWASQYERSAALQLEGIELARKKGLPGFQLPGQWFRAKALGCLGRYGEAMRLLREGFEIAERIGDRHQRARMLNTMGWLHAELGADELGAEYNRRSAAAAEEMLELGLVEGVNEIHGNASINLANNRIALGDPDGADACLEPVRDDLATGDDPWMRWRYALHLHHSEARLALARGAPERALEHLARELEGARIHESPKLVARALELAGRTHLGMDSRQAATEALDEALRTAEAIRYPPAVWRSRILLAEVARRDGDASAAEAELARARALMESLRDHIEGEELRRRFAVLSERLLSDALGTLS